MMKMGHFKKFFTIVIIVITLSLLVLSNISVPFLSSVRVQYIPAGSNIGQSLEEQLEELNRQIEQIQNQKSDLQSQLDANSYIISGYNSQLSRLYAEADIYNKEIEEITLQIKQLELQIESLDKEITQRREDISQTESTIVGLEEESNARIKDNYYNFRLYSTTDEASTMLNFTNINSFFKTSQYKELIQSGTNDVLVQLAELKQQLQDKKKDLDEKLLQVKKDKEVVDIRKTDLAKKKEEADVKIAAYLASVSQLQAQNAAAQTKIYAFSEEEIQMKAQANLIQQEIMNSYVPVGSGQYVLAGTYLGKQGCTGLCTGAHLHFMVYIDNQIQDPCGYLKSGIVDGCGGGYLDKPINGSLILTSWYGNRCFWWGNQNYCDFHTGIDIVGQPWNAPIFATHDGYAYKGVDGYGANYVVLCQNANCNSGLKTGYWHLSEF